MSTPCHRSRRRDPRSNRVLNFICFAIAQGLALAVFLSFCILWVQWQASATGVSKLSGDFVSFWTAGQLALQGHAAEAYTRLPHFALQLELHHDPGWGYLAFFYPPFFLLLCAGFALLGFFPALCVWLAATLACYVAALRALLPKGLRDGMPVWVLFLGYPAVMINAGFGQNGFLSTALFGGAAVWLDRRPALAGICLGSLAYKPQLGIIVPLALIVARRWRCFAVAAATVLVLAAAATLAFGTDVWPAFMAGMGDARRDWMEPPNPLYLVLLDHGVRRSAPARRLAGVGLRRASGRNSGGRVDVGARAVAAAAGHPVGQSGSRGDRGLRAVLLAVHARIRSHHPRRADGLAARRGVTRWFPPR